MHVLVTGAAGFIGRSVVKKARGRGWKVTSVARGSADGDIVTDLRHPVQGWPVPDAVIHLAGSYAGCSAKEFAVSDLAIAKNLIEWGLREKVPRWVFASAAEVYGDVTGVATERSPCKPVIPYGRAKLEIEEMLKKSGFPEVVICRLGEVYGPNGRILKELNGRLRSGFCPWPGNGEVPLSFLHVEDAAEVLVQACEAGTPGFNTYNVCDGEPATWKQFLDVMASLLGTRPPYFLPKQIAGAYAIGMSWADRIMKRPASVTPYVLRLLITSKVLSCARLQEDMGYVPRYPDIRTGLKVALI